MGRHKVVLATWFSALAMAITLVLVPQPAQAKPRWTPSINQPAQTSTTLHVVGLTKRRSVVRLQALHARKWRSIAIVRADRRGVYRFQVANPVRTLAYRALSRGRASRHVWVRPLARPAPRPAPTPAPPAAKAPAPSPTPAPEPVVPADACGPQPAKAGGGHWECTFQDEFNGSALDTSKWLVQETWFSGMTSGNRDCYVNGPDSVAVGSGTLQLTARRLLEPFECRSPFGNFTTTSTASTVVTKGGFSQAYGRFAFRVRFANTGGLPGSHGAAWLYPDDHAYGKWPLSGEIDVAESWSARPTTVMPTLHYLGAVPLQSSGSQCTVSRPDQEFHNYAVEWTPAAMKFFYDGKLCFTHNWTLITGLLRPFDRPFYMVLTQVWGNGWNAPTSDTLRSSTMTIDWVRAWK